MTAFLAERLGHRHVWLRVVQDLVLTMMIFLSSYFIAWQASPAAAGLLSGLIFPMAVGMGVLDLAFETSSASRRLLFGLQLLYAAGLCVQCVSAARRDDPGGLMLLLHYSLSAGAVLAGGAAAYLLARLRPAMVYYAFFAVSVSLNVILLVFGTEINGARAWLALPGGVSIQVTELIRAANCIALAGAFSTFSSTSWKVVSISALLASSALFGLVFNEIATVITLIAAAFLGAMLLMRDLRPTMAGIGLAALIVAAFILLARGAARAGISFFPLEEMGRLYTSKIQPRLHLLFHFAEEDPQGPAYQMLQARIRFLLSNLFGASQAALDTYVPVSESDMVLSTLVAALGVIPSILLIASAAIMMVWAAIFDGRSFYGVPEAASVLAGAVFCVQLVLSALSSSGYFLVLGLGLPFLAAGGTSLLAFGFMAGMIGYNTSGFCRAEAEEGGLTQDEIL